MNYYILILLSRIVTAELPITDFTSFSTQTVHQNDKKIVAAFRGMHVSPAKHSYGSVTDGRTDRKTTDKVIPMCRYASQATQFRRRHKNIDVFKTCFSSSKFQGKI